MVLNSLTSSGMVAATLSTLAVGAKFAEIGKRDIWSPARIAQVRCHAIVALPQLAITFTGQFADNRGLSLSSPDRYDEKMNNCTGAS